MSRRVHVSELVDDFPTYATSCLRILDKGANLVPLRLNHSQLRVEEAMALQRRRGRPQLIIELKARQTGLSTHAEAKLFHAAHLKENQSSIVIAHVDRSARALFRMCKRFLDHLPPQVKPDTAYSTKTEIQFGHNQSRMQVEVATEGSGRGLTSQRMHLSEFAFWPTPMETFGAVMQTVGDSPEAMVIIESTANGMNAFYDLWVDAKSGRNDFAAIFIPWFDDPGYRMSPWFDEADLDEEEIELQIRHGLQMDQLAWRRWTIRNKCNNDKELFRREYPSNDREPFLLSGRPIFERKAIIHFQVRLEDHRKIAPDPVPRDIEWDHDTQTAKLTEPWEGGPLRIYELPKPRTLYIVGADPSEGDPGSDPSPCVVLNRMTLEPVAVWHGRKRPDLLAIQVARPLAVFYNNAHVIWESNNHGLAFQIAFEAIYNDYYMRETSLGSTARKIGDKPGYNTNIVSRDFLFDNLRRYVNDMMADIRDPAIIAEMDNVYYDEKNRVRKYDRKTMDLLVALALSLEAHRGSPEVALAPLTESEMEYLIEQRRHTYVARSMGIDVGAQPGLDRIHATARDMEDADERASRRERQNVLIGVAEQM